MASRVLHPVMRGTLMKWPRAVKGYPPRLLADGTAMVIMARRNKGADAMRPPWDRIA